MSKSTASTKEEEVPDSCRWIQFAELFCFIVSIHLLVQYHKPSKSKSMRLEMQRSKCKEGSCLQCPSNRANTTQKNLS